MQVQVAKSDAHTVGLVAGLIVLVILSQWAQVGFAKLEAAVRQESLAVVDAEFVRDASAHYFMPYKGLEIIGHSGNEFEVRSSGGPRPRTVETNWKDSARFYDESGQEIARTHPCHPEYTTVADIDSVNRGDCRKKASAGWYQYQHWSAVLPEKSEPTSEVWAYYQEKIPEGAVFAKICSDMRIQVPLLMGGRMEKGQSLCSPRYDMRKSQ